MYFIKKENRVPAMPWFYRDLSSNLSAVNVGEMRAVLAGTKNEPSTPNLVRYGSWMWWKLYLYVSILGL